MTTLSITPRVLTKSFSTAVSRFVLSENKQNRLVPIANEAMQQAFADPTVRKALYRMYTVNRVVNAAFDVDANPAAFITVGGKL